MEKITLLTEQLAKVADRYPHLATLSFQTSQRFAWDHSTRTIYYNPNVHDTDQYLLHEFSHALLDHTHFTHDIDLIRMERDAWTEAVKLSQELKITIPSSLIEDALDTYRNWLHERSLCPSCNTTGIQTSNLAYRCLACGTTWHTNEARTCALRRYKTKKHPE
ncbi:MAG: hypothetical protein WBP12_05495 [Candidatus Saccharimonas sp.]